jgi:hypothetical protein
MPKSNPKNNGVEIPFQDDAFVEKWQEWLLFRKERRLPNYVPRGLKGTFTMLKRISNDNVSTAIAIIQQSMDNNYQGLFPLKQIAHATYKPNTGTAGKEIEFDRP